MYSPSVDPDKLEPFLVREFKTRQKSGTLYQYLKGTFLNYYRCITAQAEYVIIMLTLERDEKEKQDKEDWI